MPEIVALLHVSMLVGNIDRARAFYEGVLGLVPSPSRPYMAFPGVWYNVGSGQIHLICKAGSAQPAGWPEHGGRDRHAAFGVRNWLQLKDILDVRGVPYTLSRSGRDALFVSDPDGNVLELMSVESQARP